MTADQISAILDELGTKLGPTGQHVFDLAVRQIYVTAFVGIGLWVVFAIVALFITRWVYRHVRDAEAKDVDDWALVVIIGGVAAFCIFLILTINAIFCFTNLLNPEYVAITNILRAIKG